MLSFSCAVLLLGTPVQYLIEHLLTVLNGLFVYSLVTKHVALQIDSTLHSVAASICAVRLVCYFVFSLLTVSTWYVSAMSELILFYCLWQADCNHALLPLSYAA